MNQLESSDNIPIKPIRKNRLRYAFIVGVALLFLPVCYFGYQFYSAGIFASDPGYTSLPFTSNAWLDADAEERGYMADDLIERRVLTGQSREQVLALLGEPDHTCGEPADAPPSIQYNLGYRGMNPKSVMVFSYFLKIPFDEDGVVQHTVIDD